ncbi:hypothetical protein B0H15DRAFT_1022817 [Mycena belliarum]|uniref:Uncharacterized protein n=1 Tax=Mycena belliarum TaxID=1033014 RepID=A0AAD6U1T3_9AGAR|nr:hypothetical protein B0H15DRAFT_1022817 [Mycena belliae]
MIHLDRNHHPAPLSATAQNKDLILPTTNPISWPALDDDYAQEGFQNAPRKSAPGPMTPADAAPPRPASGPSSPASPPDGNSASPTRDRSSSLSPAPSPRTAKDAPPTAASRQSTPLSELSPPPDDDDDDATKNKSKRATPSAPASPSVKPDDHDPQQSSNLMPASSPSTRTSPLIDSIATPSAAGTEPTSPAPGDPKVAAMLELNEELLKVCMEFQKRKMAFHEPQFREYATRLQSNLAWAASAVDSQSHPNQPPTLPLMDPPSSLDFFPTERIQELYLELPTLFAKELARRASSSTPISLKRDRSDDIPGDVMNKRRDTGEGKMPTAMMPPPPIPSPVGNTAVGSPFSAPMVNGTAPSPVPTQLGDNPLAPQNPGMIGDPQAIAASRDRARQAQMRAQQQQQQANRQMSPPSGPNPGMSNGQQGGGNMNAVAGPSGMPPNVQHLYSMLQTPNHPLVQYMVRSVPGFQTMPVPMQLQKMLAAQNMMRERQMQNSGGGGQFSGQPSPVSPVSQMGGPGQSPQNPMFPMNAAGMDLRAMNSTPLPGGGGGMNPGGGMMTPQQRQLLLMQQQGRGGGMGGMGGGMGMSPQQMAFQQQQQQQMRMEQQQQQQRMAGMAAAQQGGSPPHPGSPMMGNDFPALRSNAGIPGIARIARSPSDGSPMTPRMTPARGPQMGAEDYQRMMQQRGGMGGPGGGQGGGGGAGFGGQQFGGQQGPAQGWGQSPMQQQMQMQGGGQYGMGGGRPGSGYGGAPSPPGSGGGGGMGGQNWGQGGGYPFSGGGAGADLGMQRQMSGTPGPQMQQNSPQADEFDPFNWPQ